MKKLVITLMLLTFFIASSGASAISENCKTSVLTCPDGRQHYVVWCNASDWWTWSELLCGVRIN